MPDIPSTNAPALSATSDSPVITPVVETPPAAVVADHPAVETPKTPPAETPKPSETAKVDPAPEVKTETPPPTPPKKDGLSSRMSELTTARKEAEAARKAADDRADKLADSLAKALDALEKTGATKVAEQARADETADPRPERAKFDDPDAYDSALIEWSSRQATRIAAADFERKAAEERAAQTKEQQEAAAKKVEEERQAEADKVVKTWTERATKAVEEFPDFDEVVYRDVAEGGPNITEPMRDAILAVENGPAVAYHLGKNPKEAERISNLSPVAQLVEMGKLAADLSRPKPNVSKAPDPITPTGSRQEAAPKSDNDLSGDEYFEKYGEARRRAARNR